MSDPTQQPTPDELLLLSQTLGEALERIKKIESEFTLQAAPIEASKAAQESALSALQAALSGIQALQRNVLEDNLGEVSTRLEKFESDTRKELSELETGIGETARVFEEQIETLFSRVEASESTRVEFSKRQDEIRETMAAFQSAVRSHGEKITELLERVEKREFQVPPTLNPVGKWEPKAYSRLDVVTLNGTSYISLSDNNTEKPSRNAKKWQVLAQRGSGSPAGGVGSLSGLSDISALGLQIAQASTALAAREALVSDDPGTGTRFFADDGTLRASTTAVSATTAETVTGTDTTKYVTPAAFAGAVPAWTNSRPTIGGLHFTGANSTRAYATGVNIGSEDVTLHARFVVPTSAQSLASRIIYLGSSATAADATASIGLAVNTSGQLQVIFYGETQSTDFRQALVSGLVSNFGGSVIDVVVTRSGSDLTIYINGAATSYSESTGGTPPDWSDAITSTYVGVGYYASNGVFIGTILEAAYTYGVALSAAEVTRLHRGGWAALPEYVHAAGAGNAYTSDFSADADGWSTLFGSTVTGNVDGVGGEDDTLLLDSGEGTLAGGAKTLGLALGKSHRLRCKAYAPASNETGVEVDFNSQASQTLGFSRPVLTEGEWYEFDEVAVLSNSATAIRAILRTASHSATVTAGDELNLKDVIIDRIGLAGRWVFDRDFGYQVRDLSGGGRHMDLTTSGVLWLNPQQQGRKVITKTFAHSGISSTAATTTGFTLPPNTVLTEITINRTTDFDANVTLDVGISGTAAKFADDIALDATGFVRTASSSLVPESTTANTTVYIQKSGATTQGALTINFVLEALGNTQP